MTTDQPLTPQNPREELAVALAHLCEIFNRKLSPPAALTYIEILESTNLPHHVLIAALKFAAANSKFFPTPAEVIEHARALVNTIAPHTRIPDADEVWHEAFTFVRKYGYQDALQRWDKLPWSSPAVADFVKSWWRELCFTDEDKLPTLRAHFRDAWNARKSRTQTLAHAQLLSPTLNDIVNQFISAMQRGKIPPPSHEHDQP